MMKGFAGVLTDRRWTVRREGLPRVYRSGTVHWSCAKRQILRSA